MKTNQLTANMDTSPLAKELLSYGSAFDLRSDTMLNNREALRPAPLSQAQPGKDFLEAQPLVANGERSQFDQTGNQTQQPNINQTPLTQTNQQALIWQNCALLLQNCQTIKNIAAKLGIAVTNDPDPSGKNLLEVKQQLGWQNQSILINIGKNLGVLTPTLSIPDDTDIVTQNHLLLLGNGLIVWALASSLRINMSPTQPLSGSIIEQNHQLLLANLNGLEAIAYKLGATPAPNQSEAGLSNIFVKRIV